MNPRRTSLFIFLILVANVAWSQTPRPVDVADSILFRPEVERQFVDAMRLFGSEKYDSAAAAFQQLIRERPRSHRETGAFIMGGKAFYFAGKARESIRMLKDLLDLYPQSSYVDDAHYTLGLDYYELHRPDDAAAEFLRVRESSAEPRLTARSERLLDALTSTLTLAQLQFLLPEARTDAMKALLNLRIAEKLFRSGDIKSAQVLLRSVGDMSPTIKYVGDALALLEETKRSSLVKVGVLLPLMLKSDKAAVRELGTEFLDGIQLAVEEHNVKALTKVSLEVRDTDRDQAVAAQQVGELGRDDKVVAILGPVLSNEVFASAGIANERGIPLITPTATSNGIAAIGPFVFQANPDFNVRGRASAAFAFAALGARRFAVVAPSDGMERQMADAFVAEVVARGGELVDAQYYAAGATDIRPQLLAVRQKAFERLEFTTIDFSTRLKPSDVVKFIKAGVSRQMLDSLIELGMPVDVVLLFGPNGKRIADSLQLPAVAAKPKVDSLALPVPNIDAMFVPIANSDEIAVISAQLKFVNFQTQVIGSGDWNDLAQLDENRQYTDGVLFSSDTEVDPKGRAYRELSARMARGGMRKPPTVNTLLGYDVCRLLMTVIDSGATRRSEIAAALPNVKKFEGIHAKVSFSPGRVNSCLSFLQYKNRLIRKIGEIDLTESDTSVTHR